jgi:hypothetical protein
MTAPRPSSLTRPQLPLFWRAFAPAWQAHCSASAIDPGNRKAQDEWRHAILFQEAHVTSLADVRRGTDFDRILKRLAVEAGDYARAADMEATEAGRIRERCEACLRQIGEIRGETGNSKLETGQCWDYIKGIIGQAYQGRSWLDIPERDMDKVFMMLDTYRRSLLKRAGWRGAKVDRDQPLGFVLGATYRRDGERVVKT